MDKQEEYAECSNCPAELPKRCMQDELPLDKPLCRKCLNAVPGTIFRLINAYDAYITELEGNRDRLQDIANTSMDAAEDMFEAFGNLNDAPNFAKVQLLLSAENKIAKDLHRP